MDGFYDADAARLATSVLRNYISGVDRENQRLKARIDQAVSIIDSGGHLSMIRHALETGPTLTEDQP